MTARRRLVRVPASSANLGPGYDAMAAAVALHLELEVAETGEYCFDPGGQDLPTGRDNLLVRAFESLHPADGIAFRLRSEIPLARGLGSSAAAIVAGLYAADHLFELALDREEMLARATAIEGHPDNVAAAIYGGFVVCGTAAGGTGAGETGPAAGAGASVPFAARFDPPDGLEGIAVIPAEEVSTERAREAIPASVPLADAVANVSSAALLVLGLRSADLDLVSRGLADRLHQPHRRSLYPRSMEIVDAAAELGALGATISGAGPTVLVWTTWQDAGGVAAALRERVSGWAEVRRLPFSPQGADVPEL
jgi:homoserine kinase